MILLTVLSLLVLINLGLLIFVEDYFTFNMGLIFFGWGLSIGMVFSTLNF